jgi:antitoxin YefM
MVGYNVNGVKQPTVFCPFNCLVIFLKLQCTTLPYINSELIMNSISVNQFRDNLKTYVEQTVNEHEPIKVTRRAGEDFIVMSADDWEREQETLHILQSSNLMMQIAESMGTHESNKGYKPTKEQLDEITSL